MTNPTLLTPLPTDSPGVQQQKKRLRSIVMNELTEAQRGTYLAYYVKGLTIPAIAELRRVNKSTVCRTLKRADDKVEKILRHL